MRGEHATTFIRSAFRGDLFVHKENLKIQGDPAAGKQAQTFSGRNVRNEQLRGNYRPTRKKRGSRNVKGTLKDMLKNFSGAKRKSKGDETPTRNKRK